MVNLVTAIALYILAYYSTSTQQCALYHPIKTLEQHCNEKDCGEVFWVESTCRLDYYRLVITNRWGRSVFAAQDVLSEFDGNLDGSPLPGGLYTYQLQYSFTNQLDTLLHTGSIRIVR